MRLAEQRDAEQLAMGHCVGSATRSAVEHRQISRILQGWQSAKDIAILSLMATDLSPRQNERLRAAMRKLRDDQFAGSITKLAEALDRKQPSISDFLNGRTGASHETAARVAALMKIKDYRDLIGEAEPRSQRMVAVELAKAIEFLRGDIPAEFLDRFAAEHDQGFEQFNRHDFVQMIRGAYLQAASPARSSGGLERAIAARKARRS